MFSLLQSEGKIGSLTIPNRVVMPAMGVNLAMPGGAVTDEIIAFYEARARGGSGLIITEVTRVAGGAGISDPCQLAAYRPGDIASLQKLVDIIHKYETRVFIQLQHPGREASPAITGEQSVAPSPVANPLTGGAVPLLLLTGLPAQAQDFPPKKPVTGSVTWASPSRSGRASTSSPNHWCAKSSQAARSACAARATTSPWRWA